jgi:prepilin-type N-terminal cleavage/methylation domain-containing protein
MQHESARRRGGGFTLRELLAVIILVAVLVAWALPVLHRARNGATQIRDAAYVREVHKSMVMWAQTNDDLFPLPSLLDQDDSTVSVDGDASLKDSTGAIYSVLIFNQLVSRETLVSPATPETDRIRVHKKYDGSKPALANHPANARWDPSFRGTPFDDTPGLSKRQRRISHTSYAHLAVAGLGRSSEWKNSLSSNFAVIGNRGPEETGGAWDPETGLIASTTLADGPTGARSLTLLIHGSKTGWEGNIAYNDNHVVMEESSHPEAVQYIVIQPSTYGASGIEVRRFGDGLFLDEGDSSNLSGGALEDTRDGNCYLGLFRRGPTKAERQEHEQAVKFIKQARWFDGMTK